MTFNQETGVCLKSIITSHSLSLNAKTKRLGTSPNPNHVIFMPTLNQMSQMISA